MVGRRHGRTLPKEYYDFLIIGGGGHGLATAFYLASEFKEKIAVIEKGDIGLGNVEETQQSLDLIICCMKMKLFMNFH